MTEQRPSSRTAWIVAGVLIAVIALVAVIAIVASGGDDETTATTPPGSSEVRPATITGDPLPTFEGSEADPAVGLAAPTVAGASFDGSPVTIEPGRVTMLVFLAHWCQHCQAEVPVLTEWEADGGVPDDVDVIGIATATTSERPNYPPSAWLAEEQFPFTVLADDPNYSVANAFGLASFPYFVVLDADGNVAARAVAELPPDELEALLAAAGA